MAAKKLSADAQVFVVQALACFDSPSTVAKAVKAQFGIDITPQAIERYDPTKHAGSDISKRSRAMFQEARERFLAGTASIGISHRVMRLRTLDRMIRKAEEMGALALVAQLLEQAAKEMGDAYTNRHRHEVLVPQATITLNMSGKPK